MHSPSLSLLRTGVSLCAAVLLFALPASAKEGFYLGVGVGVGIVSGDDNVALKADSQLPAGYRALVRTDFGSGLGIMFRIGYNILGAVAIEVAGTGTAGNFGDDIEAQGQVSGVVAIHPLGILALADVVQEDFWDPYLLIGGGYGWGVYSKPAGEEKGWTASNLTTGLGINAHVLPLLSVGLDVRFLYQFHNDWIYNLDDDITFAPKDAPTSLIVLPTINATLHI